MVLSEWELNLPDSKEASEEEAQKRQSEKEMEELKREGGGV